MNAAATIGARTEMGAIVNADCAMLQCWSVFNRAMGLGVLGGKPSVRLLTG